MPSFLAFDKPMAMACLGLVTFLPLRPLFNCPFFIAFISVSTLFPAAGEYLRDFFDELFAGAVWAELFLAELFFAGDLLTAVDFFAVDLFADEDFSADFVAIEFLPYRQMAADSR